MKIAAAAYPLDALPSFEAYAEKLEHWVAGAAADLIVFPEYGAMELAAIVGATGELQRSIDAVTELVAQADALHAALAAKYGVHILAASAPVREAVAAEGGADREEHGRAGVTGRRAVNRARLFSPGGAVLAQDKQIMTRFERELWGISPGAPLAVAETALGPIATLICYDAEFPLLARAVVEAGAEILLVPSCTDSHHGWSRVRVGAMARALENQCITVQAPTVGPAPWCPAVDENHGAAALYAPPDAGFPADGVLAMGAADRPGWARAEIDCAAIARVRSEGAQANHAHWGEQGARGPARRVTLR
ncbi:MAG: carbon-nitrogen hydrolase family protein [Pseudomonadota bacterium]